MLFPKVKPEKQRLQSPVKPPVSVARQEPREEDRPKKKKADKEPKNPKEKGKKASKKDDSSDEDQKTRRKKRRPKLKTLLPLNRGALSSRQGREYDKACFGCLEDLNVHAPFECKTCLLRFCERCNTENKRCVCRFHIGYLSEEESTDSDVSVDDPFSPEFQADNNALLAIQCTKDSARLKKAEERQRILQEDQDECERLQVTRLLTKLGVLGGPEASSEGGHVRTASRYQASG